MVARKLQHLSGDSWEAAARSAYGDDAKRVRVRRRLLAPSTKHLTASHCAAVAWLMPIVVAVVAVVAVAVADLTQSLEEWNLPTDEDGGIRLGRLLLPMTSGSSASSVVEYFASLIVVPTNR